MIITPLRGDFVRVTAEEGYLLVQKNNGQFRTEAICKSSRVSNFTAIPNN